MSRNHDEKYDKKRIELSSFISFLLGFSEAAVVYVISTYFKQASGTENIGIYYIASYLLALVLILNLHKLVRKVGKSNVFYFAVILKIIMMVLLNFADVSQVGILFLMAYVVATALEWASLDAIIESFSTDKMSGRIRGLHLTIINLGFIFGPFVSTYLLDKTGFSGVFLFSLIFNCFVLIFGLIGFRNVNHRFEQRLAVIDLLKKVLKRRNIMRIYSVAFILEFFYALMVIYMPIYLFDIGYSWKQIGEIFTVMLAPFVLLQYPVGLLADKRMGEKEVLIFAIIVMGVSTIALYFIDMHAKIYVWMAVLFATRIGAATIEILRDSYFYKRVDGHDVDVINFFRTAASSGYVVATVIFSLILVFDPPVKVLFMTTGVIILSALFPAFRLQDNKCEKEMETSVENC